MIDSTYSRKPVVDDCQAKILHMADFKKAGPLVVSHCIQVHIRSTPFYHEPQRIGTESSLVEVTALLASRRCSLHLVIDFASCLLPLVLVVECGCGWSRLAVVTPASLDLLIHSSLDCGQKIFSVVTLVGSPRQPVAPI